MENFINDIEKLKLEKDKIINIYPFGSVNYGTLSEKSDRDYVIVYEQEEDMFNESITSECGEINATLYNINGFQTAIYNHKIDALEAFFLPKHKCYLTTTFDFEFDLEKMRRSISQVCSNSWVKCKKKLAQGDDYVGLKSVFHSLRIADYGIQLATFQEIKSFDKPFFDNGYETFSDLWEDIKILGNWEDIDFNFRNLANTLRSEIRKLAPLDKDKRRTKKD